VGRKLLAIPVIALSLWAAAGLSRADGQEPAPPLVAQPATPAAPPAPAPAPAEAPKPTAGPAIEASSLDTFLLRDSKGNLVPVLDLPFEEFERLLRIKRGLGGAEPPSYSLDALSVSGKVDGNVATLQLTATIRVRKSGWTRVPLGLHKAVLRPGAKYEGPGEHFLTSDPADGYVLWLQGAGERPHVVTFQIAAGTSSAAGQTRLALSLPHATESSLKLIVPQARAVASLHAGEGLVSARESDAESSEISVLGPAGDIELAWQKGREPAAPGPALLESSGEITVKVEGENRISSDARLRVRSFGGPLESLRVRLPPGMEWVPSPGAPGYTISLVAPAEGTPGRGPPSPQILEVRFDRPATGVVEVRVLAALSSSAAPQPLMPARFEVLGAVRQRGTIDFVVEGDWLLQWKEDASVRRLDFAPDTGLAKLAARHEFSRQPCGLQLTVAARPTRISVEPVHIVHVEDRQLRLESTLKYRLRGARAEGLTFDLAGWTIDRLTPPDLVDLFPSGESSANRQTLPLLPGATLPGEFELKLAAHRALDTAGGDVSFPLPRPIADVVTPATVMISAADNVELEPQAEGTVGLSLDPSPAAVRIASRQQPPLVYRELGADEPAVFAAKMRVHTRWTTAGARAVVHIEGEQMRVEQRIDYRIAYERRRSFEILAPRGALLTGSFQVLLGEVPLTPTPVTDAPQMGDAARFQVVTPTDQIGLCQLLVKYTVQLPKWDRQKPITLALPLVVPAEEPDQQLGGQQVEFVAAEPWQLAPDPTGSDEFSRPTPTGSGQRQAFAWSRMTPLTRWTVQAAQSRLPASVVVGKAWIQSWLVGAARQDRAVFRLVADQEQLRLRLPGSPVSGSLQAGVNGKSARVVIREPATAIVDLPPSARGQESVVELWYSLEEADSPGLWTTASLRSPTIDGASPPRRAYWQLCLPADEHLLLPPARLAAEMRFSAGAWPAWRQPALSQEQLELWIGASRQDPLPRGANQYLFSTLGQMPSALDFTSAGRRVLLMGGAGLALALGLLVLNLRAARRPLVLLVIAVGIAALGLAWPEAALVIAQTAVLGVAVACAVGLWMWASSGRPVGSPPAPSAASRPGSEVRLAETPAVRSERSATPLTTATAPAASAVGEPGL
jgi:hypothetical protein